MAPQAIEQYRVAFESHTLTREQIAALLHMVSELSRQVEWFKRQLFGARSERRLVEPDPSQGTLGQGFEQIHAPLPAAPKIRIEAHERERRLKPPAPHGEQAAPFFDEAKVAVEVIEVPNPEIAQLAAEDYEIVGEKVTYRLAQRPGAYVVLKYVRQVIKRRDTGALVCAPAPAGVIEGSRADVSFIAGMMVDKLVYHLPLYRQHQPLQAAGLRISRPWLTQLMQTAASLLEPVYEAQLAAVLASRVKAIDETPIKAGRLAPGKLRPAYFWPILWSRRRDLLCLLPGSEVGQRRETAGTEAAGSGGAIERRLRRPRPVRRQGGTDARAVLGAFEARAVRGARSSRRPSTRRWR